MATPKKPWTDDNAVAAFNEALRRSNDEKFRARLLNKKDAKAAVSEAGDVEIPDDIIIRFYEKRGDTRDVFCVGLTPLGEKPKEFGDSVFCTYSTWTLF